MYDASVVPLAIQHRPEQTAVARDKDTSPGLPFSASLQRP